MANKQQATLKQERIEAYDKIVSIFPSATDMARELSLDNRATVAQWKQRGVPVEYVMVLDMVGLLRKEDILPSVKNWDLYLSKYEQVVGNKLSKILIQDSLAKTASSVLQTVLAPAIKEEVQKTLAELGIIELAEQAPEMEEETDSIL